MATAKKEKIPTPVEPQPVPEPSYPVIEGFVEKATAADIAGLFKDLKGLLTGLKGPKAEQGKKVGKISHLKNKEYVYVVSRECLAERLAPMQAQLTEQLGLFA